MNCHDNKNSNNKSHNPVKHLFHMIICCGVPILIVAVLPFFNLNSGLRATIASITQFICPIMMIFMVPMMLKGMGREHSHDDKIHDGKAVTEENKDENIIK